MPGSLENSLTLAKACCNALESAMSYFDAPHVNEAIVNRTFRGLDASGPDDQLWQHIKQLYQFCGNASQRFERPEEYSQWYANLYRLAATILSVRTFLIQWVGISEKRYECNIQPPERLISREPQKKDFFVTTPNPSIDHIDHQTLLHLHKYGLVPFPAWTTEKRRAYFLHNFKVHKQVIHLKDLPEQIGGFYGWERDTKKGASPYRKTERDLGGAKLLTTHTPESQLVLKRVGFADVCYQPFPRMKITATREDVGLKIALCLLRDSIEQGAPVTLQS